MRSVLVLCIVVAAAYVPARAQGVVGDLIAGKLVDPHVGQWAWYDLVAGRQKKKFVVRQAIVGEEKVGRKTGYWVEVEVVPEVGYRVVYKMLLTGPASDPENIARVVEKSGPDPAVEVDVAKARVQDTPDAPKVKRESVGKEDVETLNGTIRAEHYEITRGDQTMQLWTSDKIKPTGVVKLQSLDGVMVLRNHGEGGEYARSVITETPLSAEEAAKTQTPESAATPPIETHTSVDSDSATEK